MRKPMIGVMPLYDINDEYMWMLPGYFNAITAAGGIPVMLPMTNDEDTLQQLADRMDGFLFTGGQDVNPALYHEERLSWCGEPCDVRDAMEMRMLYILDGVKPILCICRGMEILNAYMNGTLYQDLASQHRSTLEHYQEPPYSHAAHEVNIVQGSPLHELLGTDMIAVNSFHHQGVKQVSDRLYVMARATDDLIEAVYLPDKDMVWAVQWHPEYSYDTDPNSQKIFTKLVDEAKKHIKDED